ncbi:MAG TPA: DUF2125 domain-containing protein [Caulobacteraceae bacterium]|jgi:hypothetical protein
MSDSDPAQAGKGAGQPRRLGLIIPWGIAVLLVIVWSGAWLAVSQGAAERIDAGVAALRQQGWQVSWQARRIGGYPFRVEADFDQLRVVDPSGWGVAAPSVRTQASMLALGDIFVGTQSGLTLLRPQGGPVAIAAPLIRASIQHWDQRPPQLAIVINGPVLTPAPGAAPFWLQRATDLQLYSRPGPDDQGAADVVMHGAVVTADSALGKIAGTGPIDLTFNPVLKRVSAFKGAGWRASVLAWAHGGGTIAVNYFSLTSPTLKLASHDGALVVSDDGHLEGAAQATLAKAEGSEEAPIAFNNGQAWLNGQPVTAAPRAF